MAYFGPAGLQGERVHPSLKAYIDCFLSSPFPKMYPRGGGPWDQDPILMRDFRIIRRFELEWKQSQEQISEAESKAGFQSSGGPGGAPGGGGLDGALNQYLDQLEEEGMY